MKLTILALVVLGLIAAISAVFVVSFFPRLWADPSSGRQNMIDVLVAARSVPAHTELTREDIEVDKLDLAEMGGYYANKSSYLTEPITLIGKMVNSDITAGSPITKNLIITDPDRATIMKALKPGMRAFPIKLSSDQIVGGLLTPGSFVDVLVASDTRDRSGGAKGEAVSKTFLERIKVIAVKGELAVQVEGDASRSPRPASGSGWTVTLLVNTAQAEALQLATTRGHVSLTLRSPDDVDPVNSRGTLWDPSKIGIMGEFFDEGIQEDGPSSSPTRTIKVISGPRDTDVKVPRTPQSPELNTAD